MGTGGCRYAAPLYVDITKRMVTRAPDAAEQEQQQDELEEYPKVFIGEVRLYHLVTASLLCRVCHGHECGQGYLLRCALVGMAPCAAIHQHFQAASAQNSLTRSSYVHSDPARPLGAQIPIMLRSSFCSLYEHTDKELTDLGECPYDQVRPCHQPLHGARRLNYVGSSRVDPMGVHVLAYVSQYVTEGVQRCAVCM